MTAFMSKQNDFLNAIQALVELEYDTREAYEEAIKKISNDDYKIKLNEFCQDHEHHIMELSKILQNHNEPTTAKPSIVKYFITKGKVVLGEVIGDQTILAAMASNEIDTNIAYERINARHDRLDDAKEILKQGLKDEKKHKKWFDEINI
jgi:rubrerythrin